MRLKKIRIAGFKSFVDPVDILLPSHLIAVVGPNGCGKSNIADAVRWVLGESSARYLRSEQLTDVIFNGSVHRKPVGVSSVELIFDNSDASLGGQYNKYSEISVKRMVTREEKSAYYLNGTRCRRKDITGLLLGAGLSARSYAIIAQGMVSQITEAQPEELRAFLEVSAGIAQYKERRRETELRIKHTQENLNRLQDIQSELDKQLEKLNTQAKNAKKYQELCQEKKLRQAQLYAIQWQQLDAQYQSIDSELAQLHSELEQKIKQKDQLEKETQDCHHAYQNESQNVISIQQNYYQLDAEIARFEEMIHSRKQRYHDLKQMLEKYQSEIVDMEANIDRDQEALSQTDQTLSQLVLELEQETIKYKQAESKLIEQEQVLKSNQKTWEDFYEIENQKVQAAQALQLKEQLLQQREKNILEQINQLNHEKSTTHTTRLEDEVKGLRSTKIELEEKHKYFKQNVHALEQVIRDLRHHQALNSENVDKARTLLNKLEREFTTLNALQQVALGRQENTTFDDPTLGQKKQLAQTLSVEAGWELAVEIVLGDFLKAVCVEDIKKYIPKTTDLIKGTMVLLSDLVQNKVNMTIKESKLASKVNNKSQLVEQLLNKVYITENIDQALEQIDHLETGHSLITKDGVWFGHNWVKIIHNRVSTEGIVKRERQLKQLRADIETKSLELNELMLKQSENNDKLNAHLSTLDEQKIEFDRVNSELNNIKTQIEIKHDNYLSARKREKDIHAALSDHDQSLKTTTEELNNIKRQIEADQQEIEKRQQEKQVMKEKRSEIEQSVNDNRYQVNTLRDSLQQLEFRHQLTKTRINPIQENIARNQNNILRLQQSCQEGEVKLAKMSHPDQDLQQQLTNKQVEQIAIKKELSESQSSVAHLKGQVTLLEQQRASETEQVQRLQKKYDDLRVERQTIKTQRESLKKTIQSSDDEEYVNIDALSADLPQDANEIDWANRLRTIEKRIQSMGAINLAAVEELQQCQARKDYLEAQHQDLTRALSTLQEAIEKIDQASRGRLTEVYQAVNKGFSTIFSRLFAGGEAHLEISGKDILDSGITVVARPPGKTNRRVQSLSGGEKALTALAFIFAIFQLKPSPFCILDEVDAPLDDANVHRFCDLVKEMSEKVQFIIITHNKVSMGLAKQLTGVTMNEPGVSRIVSVDIDKAVSLAGA